MLKVIGVVALFVFTLNFILAIFSNGYVNRNKESLFENNKQLAQKCKNQGINLMSQITTYNEYIDNLGINQTYKCSRSVVSSITVSN